MTETGRLIIYLMVGLIGLHILLTWKLRFCPYCGGWLSVWKTDENGFSYKDCSRPNCQGKHLSYMDLQKRNT